MNFRQVPAPEVAEQLVSGQPVTIIDVRTRAEYAACHVPGSRLVPLDELPACVGDLPRDRPLYVLCHSGSRSSFAGRWLAQQGFEVVNVAGGMMYWNGPVATG